jgi:hypothetical protein
VQNPILLTGIVLCRKRPKGAHPTITSYNAGVVKVYNSAYSIARFLKLQIIFPQCKNALVFYNAGVIIVNSRVVGLAPGLLDEFVKKSPKI